jgi:hypothetical protein
VLSEYAALRVALVVKVDRMSLKSIDGHCRLPPFFREKWVSSYLCSFSAQRAPSAKIFLVRSFPVEAVEGET